MRGWEQVSEALEHTASRLREGEVVDVETVAKCVTSELAYVVSVALLKVRGEAPPRENGSHSCHVHRQEIHSSIINLR